MYLLLASAYNLLPEPPDVKHLEGSRRFRGTKSSENENKLRTLKTKLMVLRTVHDS